MNKRRTGHPHLLFRIIMNVLLVVSLLATSTPAMAKPLSQGISPQGKAAAILAKMTTAEKVGQLFTVTFRGQDTTPESEIYSLIARQHIGGVMLLAKNDNFTGPDGTVQAAYELNRDLQTVKWNTSNKTAQPDTGVKTSEYIPLLIGTIQKGGEYPGNQIFNGLSTIPNQMTIGAGWQVDIALKSGEVLGSELSALGFNFLLGPSMDVLESPSMSGDDLSTSSFGGDPYWVGEMGKAYIKGLHTGSNNRLMVIAKYFPGRGAADRPLDQEVATVRKSLEQLKQIELAPFFTITNGEDPSAITDGLLVSHLRYQGFQGNIRATTKPVSLDPTALTDIMALPQFSAWRSAGGVIMSDDLGSKAIRRFVDPTFQTFDTRQTARSAFLAGNDILYMDDFTAPGDEDSFTSVKNTIDFFIQRYEQDTAFAQRVDTSVLNILTMKYRLYPTFDLEQVIPAIDGLNQVGKQTAVDAEASQLATTLIDPSPAELQSVLPDPPDRRDRIIFLIDTLRARQCSTCSDQEILSQDALERSVLKVYGPSGSNQISSDRMISYSFQSVQAWLDKDQPPKTFEQDLRQATWVVVALNQPDPNRPESTAFSRLLADKPELLRNKKVVVFALSAPYYLDATDIAKTSAYYGIFGNTPGSLDEAARILFQDFPAHGSSPVSIPGVGYDLITATSPDPAQLIPLMLDLPAAPPPVPGEPTPLNVTATPVPVFKIGDTLPMRTGVILDHNGHPVPDNTVVRFIINTGGETVTTQQIEATTSDGVARASYRISDKGMLQIRVASEPAITSAILQLDVPADAGAAVTAVAPTALPTETVQITSAATAVPTEINPIKTRQTKPGGWIWLLGMLVLGAVCWIIYRIGKSMLNTRWGIRWGLCALIGGIIGYLWISSGLPGGLTWYQLTGDGGVVGAVFLTAALGWSAGILWYGLGSRNILK